MTVTAAVADWLSGVDAGAARPLVFLFDPGAQPVDRDHEALTGEGDHIDVLLARLKAMDELGGVRVCRDEPQADDRSVLVDQFGDHYALVPLHEAQS